MQSKKIKYIIVKTSGFFAKIVGLVTVLFIGNNIYNYIVMINSNSWISSSSDYRFSSTIFEAFLIFGLLAIVFVTFGYSILIDILKEKKILD